MTFKDLELVKTKMGAISIRNKIHGEILHNPVGPWPEARKLYVAQARLRERLLAPTKEPLVIYDVGLGAGFNALATLELFSKTPSARPLSIYSFEVDFSLYDFAFENLESFPESLPFKTHLQCLRQTGVYEDQNFKWVRLGNFLDAEWTRFERAEVIFFDPYSPKVDLPIWTLESFELVAKAFNREVPNALVTYSSSTPVRTAMLLSGLYVGAGESSGEKKETTFASTYLFELKNPLGERWLQRWSRSHEAIPFRDNKDKILTREEIYQRLMEHPQFRNLAK